MKIVILDGYAANPGDLDYHLLEKLGEVVVYPRTSDAEKVERAKDADIILLNKVQIDAETLAQLPKLKYIGIQATGFNVVDIEAARKQGIIVTNIPAYSTDSVAQLVALNTTALVRLASAIAPRLAKAGAGAIINIGSVVGLAPEFGMSVYGATKAFVLFLSQGLSLELSPQGVYVQAVLPAATRTEIWDRAGIDINTLSEVMEVADLVDAALVGFDRREPVTIPPLQEGERWDALQTARQGLLSQIRQSVVAPRYLT